MNQTCPFKYRDSKHEFGRCGCVQTKSNFITFFQFPPLHKLLIGSNLHRKRNSWPAIPFDAWKTCCSREPYDSCARFGLDPLGSLVAQARKNEVLDKICFQDQHVAWRVFLISQASSGLRRENIAVVFFSYITLLVGVMIIQG